ncbi:MAG: pYEATS domain-containing protein [Bacteroidota bacterium]
MSIDKSIKYKTKQSKRRNRGSKDSWSWSVWIDAKREYLEEIDSVVYILHPTFKDRVRTISSIESNFKLSSKGWGEFTIFIRIYFKDSEKKPLHLTHELVLFSGKGKSKQKVFISSQIKDKKTTETLISALQDNDFEVTTSESINAGQDISQSIEDSIDAADIMIVIGSDILKFQEFELLQAAESDKNTFILSDTLTQNFENVQHIRSTDELLAKLNKLQ